MGRIGKDELSSNLKKEIENSIYQTAGGTATEITLDVILKNGYPKTFIASANNNGDATTINSKPLYKPNTTTSPKLVSGKAYTVWYNTVGDCFFLKASAEGNTVAEHVLAGDIFSTDEDTGIVGTMPIAPAYPDNNTGSDIHAYGTTKPNNKHNLFVLPPKGYYDGVGDWVGVDEPNLIPDNLRAGITVGNGLKITGSKLKYGVGDSVRSGGFAGNPATASIYNKGNTIATYTTDDASFYFYKDTKFSGGHYGYKVTSPNTCTVRKYDDKNNILWTTSVPNFNTVDFYLASTGHILLRCYNTNTLVKLNPDTGEIIWTKVNVLFGNSLTYSDPNGGATNMIGFMDIDSNDNIYIGFSGTTSLQDSKGALRKYDSNLNLLWHRADVYRVKSIRVLSNGYIFAFGGQNNSVGYGGNEVLYLVSNDGATMKTYLLGTYYANGYYPLVKQWGFDTVNNRMYCTTYNGGGYGFLRFSFGTDIVQDYSRSSLPSGGGFTLNDYIIPIFFMANRIIITQGINVGVLSDTALTILDSATSYYNASGENYNYDYDSDSIFVTKSQTNKIKKSTGTVVNLT